MNGITAQTLRTAALYVEECEQHAEIRKVTITTTWRHGGVDVVIVGNSLDGFITDDYKRTYEVQ